MQEEIWKAIPGYEGLYEVSNCGNIRNHFGKILSQDTRKYTGYRYVILCKNKKTFHANIHRLVALAFIENPQNLPIVNHINEKRYDNRVENLEWCTQSYNICISTKFNALKKKICKKNINGEILEVYNSIHDAAKSIGNDKCATNICACVKGRSKTYKGYIWSYSKK